ncbi:MAG: aminomethyl-transferring glycine dehydrogenase [Bdellovibrionia bacterium]
METLLNSSSAAFAARHIGPDRSEVEEMLKLLKVSSLNDLVEKTIPATIRQKRALQMRAPIEEYRMLKELREMAEKNQVFRSYIGMGYNACITPPVIQRNVLENPGWYTQYTPYQAEIAQGRLEALLNFQTMVMELTGFDIANSSMLDEGTAAAEAMTLCQRVSKGDATAFFISDECHPQTIEVVKTRAEPLGIEILVGSHEKFDFKKPVFGILLQYPSTFGVIYDYRTFTQKAHANGALVVAACDPLALTLLLPPGQWGADVAVGSTQRFGVPLGYGGPHAAFLATKAEFKRQIPGRIVGVSKDTLGRPALRLALQTREQHIRRDKASSNICTAQVLLAVMASMYAVYHGPSGLKDIARRVNGFTQMLAEGLRRMDLEVRTTAFFDTIKIALGPRKLKDVLDKARAKKINMRIVDAETVGVTLDETTHVEDIVDLLSLFGEPVKLDLGMAKSSIPRDLMRTDAFLSHQVFNSHHSETEMLRYIRRLEAKDLSLTTSMIPLGSCTMKLNATAEMFPVSDQNWSQIHPFAPLDQAHGYQILFQQLEAMLSEITGFPAISLQPNAGSQGEYAGLLVIRKYLKETGQGHRNICLIPQSAHGTNPASAVMAGMKVAVVKTDAKGNIDIADLRAQAELHKSDLAALMVTYPSTHGVFEESITEICEIIHSHGGQVYMDGANMNAQVGLCRPADYGADVLHLNLHKTFCIPHGGGGPGMGPIGVKKHLATYLPSNPVIESGGEKSIGSVSAAPWSSANILVIPWAYIRMMGGEGLTRATQVAILNANYIAKKLDAHYPVLYKGKNGFVAHECIVDLRDIKDKTGIDVEDVAKRLMDYGFHAPTVSFPVAGTMMIEPTESESAAEIDRFCDALISIREEIKEVEAGKMDPRDNPLKNAPHTAETLTKESWTHPYSREKAAFPAGYLKEHKFWPPVSRIDAALGDRNLICACPPVELYMQG